MVYRPKNTLEVVFLRLALQTKLYPFLAHLTASYADITENGIPFNVTESYLPLLAGKVKKTNFTDRMLEQIKVNS